MGGDGRREEVGGDGRRGGGGEEDGTLKVRDGKQGQRNSRQKGKKESRIAF